MKQFMKKTRVMKAIQVLLIACSLLLSVLSGNNAIQAGSEEPTSQDIVILYTNDTHNTYKQSLAEDGSVKTVGFAALADYKKMLISKNVPVTLVDAGDAVQGALIGAISKGNYLISIMNQTGYDIAVPGNHEFDFKLDGFDGFVKKAKFSYICCNFSKKGEDNPLLDAYKIVEYNGKKVAYIGIVTPDTMVSTAPKYFQDKDGNMLYDFKSGQNGQELYTCVQNNIDAAKNAGADYIVAVGHLGVDMSSSPWTSKEVISNTSGLDAFIDGHSHTSIPQEICKDKKGEDVVLTSTGSYFAAFGQLIIKSDNTISSSLISDYKEQDQETLDVIAGIEKEFDDIQKRKIGSTQAQLVINDPVSGNRIVRVQECSIGDFCADAIREVMGADVAFCNAGGLRSNLEIGDVTYGNIINVCPFGNRVCMVETTGQKILDALEMSSGGTPTMENGTFQQVSGLTYEIDTTIPSGVQTDADGNFAGVKGAYRVQNVKIGGKPIDLAKTYTLASNNYQIKDGGGGLNMFLNDKMLEDETVLESQALIDYFTNTLGENIAADSIYANPYGEGRIKVIVEKKAATTTSAGYQVILRGQTTVKEELPIIKEEILPTIKPEATLAPSALPTSTPTAGKIPASDMTLAAEQTIQPASATAAPAALKNEEASSAKTGDSSQMFFWITLMASSALAANAVILKKGIGQKQNNN